jgi:pimeloyl-ACP methyl ester carboxylesterase
MRQHRVRYVTIHGHRRGFVRLGSGPVLLLLHGLGANHTTWLPVLDSLARRYTVIAPDLLGHGVSDKPRADYSVGGFANGMRDLLTVLKVDKVTVVGHSFGGGVAMQFAYQFPERTERLVLVGSGGLGPEVSTAIRAITTPGFHQVMGLLTLPGVRHVGGAGLRALSRTGVKEFRDFDEVAEIYQSFRDPAARAAIRHVVRAVVDWQGQIVTMADRAYLTDAMPICVIWGDEDRVIPTSHAGRAAELAPKARVEIMPNAGHFPHKDHPERFAELLHDFVRSTRPASYSRARWRRLLENGADARASLTVVPAAEASGA